MASFFFELLTEEIPARMQKGARENLKVLLKQQLTDRRLSFSDIYVFTTPRRIGAHVTGLPQEQGAHKEEFRGPRVEAPEASILGFLKSQSIDSLEKCSQKETPKGRFWIYEKEEKAQPTKIVLGEILKNLLQTFPWPKTMRWGTESSLWIRPLQGVLALFEGEVVPCEFNTGPYKIVSSSATVGHRFLSPEPFEVSSYEDYKEKLRTHYVIIEPEERQATLIQKVNNCIKEKSLSLVEDAGLLEEVTGLVEWPVPYIGAIPSAFMDLPREVLTTSMRVHQRYFSLETPEGKMVPSFLFVANQEGSDAGQTIIAGNEKVLHARLTDALFFWKQDQKKPLTEYVDLLKSRVFYRGLGSLYDKAKRLEGLCGGAFGKDILENKKIIDPQNLLEKGKEAGFLAKADLATQMVGEFPELQGIMGSYYGKKYGEDVCQAIYHQYKIDHIAQDMTKCPLSAIVALADRVDTLYGFFSLKLLPTGSKDPFALRRAALGILQLLRINQISVPLYTLFERAHQAYESQGYTSSFEEVFKELKSFFAERLRALLKEEDYAPDSIQASFKEGWEDNIPLFFDRVQAVDAFFQEKESQALFFAYRRASSILKGMEIYQKMDPSIFEKEEEKRLFNALTQVRNDLESLKPEEFKEKFLKLGFLKEPLDAFFDHVTVNVEKEDLRYNRLALLQEVTCLFERVADFSKIEKDSTLN